MSKIGMDYFNSPIIGAFFEKQKNPTNPKIRNKARVSILSDYVDYNA